MAKAGSTYSEVKTKKPFFLSLRIIASVTAAGLVAVTVAIIAGVNERDMRETLIREAQTQLVLEARNLAVTSSDPLLSEFPELTLAPLAKDLMEERQEYLDVAIVNHEGKIQGSPVSRMIGTTWNNPEGLVPVTGGTLLAAGEKLSESNKIFLAESPINYGSGSFLGWVALTLDKSFIEAKVLQHRKELMTIAAALLLGALILTGALMSMLFSPLSHLKKGLEHIGRGELNSPIKVRDFTELGMLARTLNNMASQLKASRNLAQAREKEIMDTQREVIQTLGQVVESRSTETANHTIRVGDMSYELALLAGLPDREADMVRVASPMHDVGKIGIPDSILNKPGKLTLEEYKTMQSHPEIGYSILQKSERPVFKAAAIIAREHHERWDGMGYPRKLAGEDIHIYGRIVALVDVFDALFSNRVYRKAMPLPKVLEILQEEKGNHFDPRLAQLFLDNLNKFLAIAERYQDDPVDLAVPEVLAPSETVTVPS